MEIKSLSPAQPQIETPAGCNICSPEQERLGERAALGKATKIIPSPAGAGEGKGEGAEVAKPCASPVNAGGAAIGPIRPICHIRPVTR